MSDSHFKEFFGRLERIDKIHRSGGGFEADGTLGQSHYTRERARRARRAGLRPALLVVLFMVVLKGFLLASQGEEVYRAKLSALRSGSVIEMAGAYVMAQDPISNVIAVWVKPLVD
ncbi:hypothetical protein [Tropicimonas isoalkanivorans]|uniref:Uncharacterized protein n=1 Tax=Tropicimonas isoalkanivorans TaxID=441112 RepID=A0A1I1NF09_9RHOB|nr:hypothetical protein [Tropicimonas isoalkanivorans]SFC96261.1 hypothetical protein SAMN04488094_11244 [Tropicimonas isoalkanivorans]